MKFRQCIGFAIIAIAAFYLASFVLIAFASFSVTAQQVQYADKDDQKDADFERWLKESTQFAGTLPGMPWNEKYFFSLPGSWDETNMSKVCARVFPLEAQYREWKPWITQALFAFVALTILNVVLHLTGKARKGGQAIERVA